MNRRVAVVLATLAVVSAVGWLRWMRSNTAREQPPTPTAARPMVFEYLRALEARDRSRILKLVHGDPDSGKIESRLHRFGGIRVADADVRISADLSPYFLSVSIRTSAADRQGLTWAENVYWHDGRWWLALEVDRPAPRPTSNVERPTP